MADTQQGSWDAFFSNINTRIRDLEEKQRILRDRILLLSETFLKDKEKIFGEVLEMKNTVEKLKDENSRIKEILFRIGEAIDKTVRKEELMILQRQFELFREK